MNEELVVMDDLLMAMADSLMEKQPKAFNPVLKFQDQKIEFKLGGKPPREVFYRNTVTFMTKLPPPVPNKACSVKYMCDGVDATIKCHSCCIYDPSGTAFYCDACFQACHPWYRVSHIYSQIEKDESIEHTLKIAHRVAEANRYEKEGKEILARLRREKPKLEYVANDELLDKQMRIYGRKTIALEEYIHKIRQELQEDIKRNDDKKSLVGIDFQQKLLIESSKLTRQSTASSFKSTGSRSPRIKNKPSPKKGLSNYTDRHLLAVIKIQKWFRGYLGRKTISSIMTLRLVRVWNPDEGRDFYYDRVTGTSSWVPSKLLRKEDYDFLEYIHYRSEPNKWACKRIIQRRRQGSINESRAIKMLQGFLRCCYARTRVIRIADEFYRKVYDEETSSFYYANMKTGETSWEKSRLYLMNEPPIFNAEHENKRNPRVNRVTSAPKSR